MRAYLGYAAFPLRLIRRFATFFTVLALTGSLLLNLSMLTVSGVYVAASAALSGMGASTTAAREASDRRAQREAVRQVGHDTAQRVSARMQRGAARDIASAGAEALPVVGIAVIAGALALEVKDACDTSADMAGLEAALATEGDAEAARQAALADFDCTAMIREQIPQFESLPGREDIWSMIALAPAQAFQQARNAGTAVGDIDWSGKPVEAGDRILEWVDYLGTLFLDQQKDTAQ